MIDYKNPQPNDPPYLLRAFEDLGLREIAGPRHNARVLEMFAKAGHPQISNDETAWCAAAMGCWLAEGGKPNTKSLMARSYVNYGTRLDLSEPIPRGAIAIWPRGTPPSGHVNIVLHDDGEYLTCIGGNQSPAPGSVSISPRERKDRLVAAVLPPDFVASKFEIEAVQQRLKNLGYHEVGMVDGKWGSRTTAAIAAFQADNGLPVTGKIDEATKLALATAKPRQVSEEREKATVDDLDKQGSETVKQAKRGGIIGWLLSILGIGGAANETGTIDKAQETVGQVSMIGSMIEGVKGALVSIAPYWPLVLLGIGGYLIYSNRKIILRRLEDFRAGIHAGR